MTTVGGRGGFRNQPFSELLEYGYSGDLGIHPRKLTHQTTYHGLLCSILTQLKCSSPQTHQKKHRNTEEAKNQNKA